MMLLDALTIRTRQLPAHLRGLWKSDIETQILWSDDSPPTRIGESFHDSAYLDISKAKLIGVSGWNYVDKRSVYGTIDLDSAANHAGGLSADELASIIDQLCKVNEVEILRSKSGNGYHLRVYFDPDNLPHAATRNDHGARINRVVEWLTLKTGIDLVTKKDCAGYLAWIWASETGPRGFELVKPSTAFLPADIDWHPVVTTSKTDYTEPVAELTDDQKALVDWLQANGRGEFDPATTRLNTHTAALAEAKKALKLRGTFHTIATGRGGPSDRNCFAHPKPDATWIVCRHGKGTAEHVSWWRSDNGYTTTRFNAPKPNKADAASTIVGIGEAGELFRDADGQTYATIDGQTVGIGDDRHSGWLRLRYTDATGLIASREAVNTSIAQLKAIASNHDEYPVGIRVANHGDKLYIDLANAERKIVECSPAGWRLVDSAPVRFRRPFGMLSLPTPRAGGSIDELRPFANVAAEDWPLLCAFIVGCYHPRGPYPLLQLVGEQGSAKTSLTRLIHDFCDPNTGICGSIPREDDDLIVAASHRRLLSFDNLSSLDNRQSDNLCKLATGAAIVRRTKYSDNGQTVLRAKRPSILTSIKHVITKSDLLDRTLTLHLPPIQNRRTEFDIENELRRDGVRQRIFGAILNGVVSALAGHSSVTADVRMADFFSWATAAEPGLGLPVGSMLAAYRDQANEYADTLVTDSVLAAKIIDLAGPGFRGTAKELCERVSAGYSPREMADELRELAPALRRQGLRIDFTRSKGRTMIRLATWQPQMAA